MITERADQCMINKFKGLIIIQLAMAEHSK